MNTTTALQTLRTLHERFTNLSDAGATLRTLLPLFEAHTDIMTANRIGDRKTFGDNEMMQDIIADLS